ncbi:exopolysaccharide production protein YjbE [Mixta intestinalis]|jgi:deoxycytidylate deaminase|uniref:exopolysaccharide production protein YjbE n=1 Tax=Mixta intestinalis TaxID=1615494 RepID=UPI001FCCA0D0|nr:exopolysaccharide production protein YjbE [Mixta intestinalis]
MKILRYVMAAALILASLSAVAAEKNEVGAAVGDIAGIAAGEEAGAISTGSTSYAGVSVASSLLGTGVAAIGGGDSANTGTTTTGTRR